MNRLLFVLLVISFVGCRPSDGTVSGRVTFIDGTNEIFVSDAPVFLQKISSDGTASAFSDTRTNNSGHFDFFHIPEGQWKVKVQKSMNGTNRIGESEVFSTDGISTIAVDVVIE